MSTETTQPTEQGYENNYYGDGYGAGYGDGTDAGADYYNQYDANGNWIGDGAQEGGYDAAAYDPAAYDQAVQGYDGGGNPINQLNETAADQHNYHAEQQQQQYADPNVGQNQGYVQDPVKPLPPATAAPAVAGDQEMQPRGVPQKTNVPPTALAHHQGQGGFPPQGMAPQQLQAGGSMSHAQAHQMVLNQNAPAEMQRQLNQLLGKSPGTALKEHEPESDGWLADIMMTFGTSLGFKLYIMYLLWSSFVLFGFIGYDFIYATLYRMMVPPEEDQSRFGQSTAYLCIFFSMSFCVVSVLCVCVDMMRDFWTAGIHEPLIWGIKVYDKKGPWPIYALLIFVNLVAPLLWSMVATVSSDQSVFYFFQHFSYTSQTLMMFVVLLVFVWFWFRAGREKGRALARRKNSPDECGAVRQTNLMEAGGKPDVLGALSQDQDDPEKVTTWWKSDIVMAEWGMDQSSMLWMIVVFSVCFAPLLAILVFVATEGDSSGWNAAWLVIAVIFFCVLILLHQTAMSRRKKGLSAVCSFLGLGSFIIFGLIGGGAAGNGALVGVFVVILLLSQGMLTRKRLYDMTRREIYHHFKQPFDLDYEERRQKKLWDSYCCCCKNLVFSCCRCCFDINKVFGFEYPEIHKMVKTERKKRVALRTDQNFLAIFWWILCVAFLVILSWARLTLVDYSGAAVAELTTSAGTDAVTNNLPVCTMDLGGELTLYEMSLLAALTLSAGDRGKTDYTTWFGGTHADLIPDYSVYPVEQSDQAENPHWTYVGYIPTNASAVNYVAVRGTAQGANWMQSLDTWGDSLTLQVAGALAPHTLIWPQVQKASFVNGVSFLKQIYGGKQAFDDVEAYVRSLSGQVILVGQGFAGGAAQMIAMKTGQKAVAFNAPGIGYLYEKYSFSNPLLSLEGSQSLLSVSSARNLFSMIDLEASVGSHQTVPCSSDSHQTCTDMTQLVQTLKDSCGDAFGRKLI